MENSVFFSELASEDIKPALRLARYRLLASEFNLAQKEKSLVEVSCPFCDSKKEVSPVFSKSELTYVCCGDCRSLYVKARPSEDALTNYYRDSEARVFWTENIYQPTLKVRKKKALEPLAEWVEVSLLEWQSSQKSQDLTIGLVRPTSFGLSEVLKEKGYKVSEVEPMYPNAKGSADASASFDAMIFEDSLANAFSPKSLLADNWKRLKPGGLAFFTLPLASGFDVLTLKEISEAVHAPDRLNIPSYEVMNQFLKTVSGSEVLEFSTPGVLDLQNVFDAKEKLGVNVGPFFDYLYHHRNTPNFIGDFQKFLQSYGLSSQARIVLMKNQ